MDKILEAWEKLEKEILDFAGEDKIVRGKDHDLPYRDRMYNLIRKVRGMENLPSQYSWMTSSEGMYEYMQRVHQVKREKKIQPLTIDRLREEFEEARACGFSNGDKWKYDAKNYASYHNISLEEVMHQLGYAEYKSPVKGRTIASSIKELEDWSEPRGGYLDGIYGSKAEPALRFLYKRAGELDMDGSMYITLMSDKLKFAFARLYIDYFDVVERRYAEYVKNHGGSKGIKEKDPTLYGMLMHISEYAPGGSMSMNETRQVLGITPTGRGTRSEHKEVDIETEIGDLSVDGVVSKITDDRELHDALVKLSLRAGTTVEGIVSSSAHYKNGMTLPRLSRVAVCYTGVIDDVKKDLRDAWTRVDIDIEDSIEKREAIAKELYDREVERVIALKVSPTVGVKK